MQLRLLCMFFIMGLDNVGKVIKSDNTNNSILSLKYYESISDDIKKGIKDVKFIGEEKINNIDVYHFSLNITKSSENSKTQNINIWIDKKRRIVKKISEQELKFIEFPYIYDENLSDTIFEVPSNIDFFEKTNEKYK